MDNFPRTNAHFFIAGSAGQIEVLTSYPKTVTNRITIICHPHPLYEGSLHNKVVTMMAKTFDVLGVATARFNFRGVGQSEGTSTATPSSDPNTRNYECEAELDDLRAVLNWVKSVWSDAHIWLAGFSFGSYVAARIAEEWPTEQLISVAPPVERMPFAALTRISCPWLVIQGEADEIVSPEAVFKWAENPPSALQLIRMSDVGHFFHGKLTDLREVLLESLKLN